ncbi:MAG TPA: imidazole glycerol phosphate synthase subunit HisH [Flavitalea sp.]|nr:imidazole glycerol phosphate synthase subunit HisH [Flavitalea sp.]
MKVIKYNAGNVQSVIYALERLGLTTTVTDDADELRSADKIIFPGVGEASTAMEYLKQRGLDILIRKLQQPVLGICLGMQLMCRYSEENDTQCMGIFAEAVRRFEPGTEKLKVPQVGWNSIYGLSTPLFDGIADQSHVYSVHSYYVAKGPHTIANINYGIEYSAALHKENFYGVQFHPEKSAETGLKLLENFIAL